MDMLCRWLSLVTAVMAMPTDDIAPTKCKHVLLSAQSEADARERVTLPSGKNDMMSTMLGLLHSERTT